MDSLRLIRLTLYFVVGLFLGGWSVLSFALTVQPTSWSVASGVCGGHTYPNFSSPGEAGPAVAAWSNTCLPPPNVNRDGGSSWSASCAAYFGPVAAATSCYGGSLINQNGTPAGQYTVSPNCPAGSTRTSDSSGPICSVSSCPSGTELFGTQCLTPCVAPSVRDSTTGVCVPPPCPAAGSSTSGVTGTFYTGAGSLPPTICVNSCSYSWTGVGVGLANSWGAQAGKSTGASCSSNSGSGVPPTDPRSDCLSKGQGFGTVNNVVVCTAPAATSSASTSSSTPASGPASTTSVTNNTSCSGDGSCTTTTTTTTTSGGSGPGGTGPGSTTTTDQKQATEPKPTFCAENPNLSICKDSSFAGSCDTGAAPACSGDAVQCAQANAAFELKCSAVKDDDAQKLARAVVAGNDPQTGTLPNPNNATVVPVGTLDNTEIFNAGCPSNPGFTAFGRAFSFNLAPLCSMGETLGKLNVMLALMGALWIVAGSVKGA